jgi:FAD/FMN-containing dehydrogenase
MVIDLGRLKGIHVDPGARVARVQAGVLLGELDRATQEHGLAVPLGSVTHTGVAGLTLGGGFGWLMRKHGLAIDQLLSATMVTADGGVLVASETANPELFWGVRGGGGNFGIVTEFEFRLNPVGPSVLSALVLWPLDDGLQVGGFYRDWADALPDEMTSAFVLRRAPSIEAIPAHLHGLPVVGVAACWIGPLDEGERVLKPMRQFGSPVVDLTAPRLYVEHQAMFDSSYPHGIWVYSKAADVKALSDAVLDITIDHAARAASPRSGTIAWQLGGAVARAGELATPFGSRSSGYLIDVLGATDSAAGFDLERNWARACWSALAPHHAGVYVNWLMDEGEGRVRQAYGDERYARLQAVKRRYDPDNIFHLNQNVLPAPVTAGAADR